MSEKAITSIFLNIVYDPKGDKDSDIEMYIRRSIQHMIDHGQLEGCEHGAKIDTFQLQIMTSRIN
jgi:hypothetical protein